NFHYGYFVQAAATVGMFDRDWVSQDKWGGMVDLLVADVANANRGSGQFPWLRSFDPYAGHSWASGHGAFQAGNNNESSTEALNFDAAVALWGAVTGRDGVRDLGIELHAVESAAVLQYWFDVDHAVFPDGFPYQATGMIWGDGASHTTWFSDNPEMIHGINEMPISAATSLYLATHQDKILANYAEMAAESGGSPRYWKNIQWEYLALADPGRALADLQADPNYSLDEGGSGSYAQTLHWISSLAALGTLNSEVRADTPFQAVFAKNGVNTYVAYNAGDQDLVVHFTDGTVLTVAPHTEAALRDGKITPFHIGGDAVGGPDPGPTPGPIPAPNPGPTPNPNPNPNPAPDPGHDPQPTPHGDGLRLTGGGNDFNAGFGTITLASAAGTNHDGTPHSASLFSLTGVTAHQEAGQVTHFALKVDAGAGVGDAAQMAVSYDFTGDGSVDRTETWRYFATDNVMGWETYGSDREQMSATGAALQDLVGGTVTAALWTALGTHPVQVDLAASSLSLPFQASGVGTVPVPDPVPGPVPTPDPVPVPNPGPVAGSGLMLVNGIVRFDPQHGPATLAASNGANHDGTSHAATSFMLEHVTAGYLAADTTGFRLLVDAGAQVGDAVQAAVSYDFDGNGTFDRTETWRYFATDDGTGWQAYGSDGGPQSVSGTAMRALEGGTVNVDLWTAIGAHPVAVDLAASSLDLPFRFGGGGSEPTPTPTPTPTPAPGPSGPPDSTHFVVSADSSGLQLSTPGDTVIASAGNGRYIDQPHDALVLKAEGLHAQYGGGSVVFALPLDAGMSVGSGTQLRLSFDFDGNGVMDRTETRQYFATNNTPGWESYSQASGLNNASGYFADFTGGSVTAELWNAIGDSPVTLHQGASVILPYSDWLV
ncbi:MAG: glycosyl hydrolase, partial [Reyranella sp.]|nr:glycosyl hydrolase [Reyranella sp.]